MKSYILIPALFIITASCNKVNNETATENGASDKEANAATTITVSDAQQKSIGVETARVTTQKIFVPISATGLLDVPPQNLIDISAPYGGFVKHTDLLQGMKVNKGDVLVELQHPDYIQLQQDYLNQVSQLQFNEVEYNRQEALAKENVNAQKSLQQAKANYESTKANVEGLSAKLSLLNIKPETLKNGIQKSIRLYAPISGFITEVNINLGKFVSPSDVMIRIVNTQHLHAELQVFEKDISQVKIGQPVKFKLSNETKDRMAEVYLIGKEISPERTVRIHCHLTNEDTNLIPGMFITASIETEPRDINAIPSEAIVQHEGKRYVFIKSAKANEYMLQPVTVGAQHEGYTEIVAPESILKNELVVKGSYALLGMLFNTEESE